MQLRRNCGRRRRHRFQGPAGFRFAVVGHSHNKRASQLVEWVQKWRQRKSRCDWPNAEPPRQKFEILLMRRFFFFFLLVTSVLCVLCHKFNQRPRQTPLSTLNKHYNGPLLYFSSPSPCYKQQYATTKLQQHPLCSCPHRHGHAHQQSPQQLL